MPESDVFRVPTVLAAVKQNGKALKFASERLRSEREIVLEAVRQYRQTLFCQWDK